ncbi:hypothetical protein C4K03_2848 [Pseudomonas synxantha]|uniref:Uncharacterized protein n=1 Tax=Pseudomonas synxantha TaxID=47883 RepID=A0A3G7U6U2_9PSED|nr:hypothetical protein [Pseudomonas synxantha]AZE55003.1 hypothetical protein C4K03_2848 [Pseudomonas synxantha]
MTSIPSQMNAHWNPSPPGASLDGAHALTKREAPQAATLTTSADLMSPQELAQALQVNFEAMLDPRIGGITRDSLQRVADEQPLNGTLPTQEQIEIAQELLKRRDLFTQLSNAGQKDGLITRDELAISSQDYQHLSDRGLIDQVGKFFNEYGGGDEYVNFNELKEAAGEVESSKTYTPQERGVAKELLKRQELLDQLDIGVGFLGFAGKQDQRFDRTNVEHTGRNSSVESRYPG